MTVNTPFELGKLPAEHLGRLLSRFPLADPRVVVGPRVGEDAAVIDFGGSYLVAKSDPITFATDAIGWYAVHVNANDVACAGAQPRWFLCTVLLPHGRADATMVDDIFDQVVQACGEVGATLVGGHTEITYGIDRPILAGLMLGEVARERLVTTGGALTGDAIVLTQRVAVEATAIIAREKREELLELHGFDPDYVEKCADFIYRPGISVVPAARVATAVAPIHAMHDPTEGGLATGLWELAAAAGVGLEIEARTIPVYPETRHLCDAYGLDPWGVIASGSLLLTLDANDAQGVCDALDEAGVEATVIGRVSSKVKRGAVRVIRELEGEPATRQRVEPLQTYSRDEITRLFE
jgi:hydrogenase expression/formation protein HypE